jgi:hypothetical protein
LSLGACFSPSYDHPACGPQGECPSGFTCEADVCVTRTSAGDAGGDGGNSDGAVDGPPDAAALFCNRSDLLFCEDFENVAAGTPTSGNWTLTAANGAATIAGTHALGSQAIHITLNANGGFTHVNISKALAAPPTVYARFRIWFDVLPTSTSVAAGGVLHTTPSSMFGGGYRVSPGDGLWFNGKYNWLANGDKPSVGEWTRASTDVIDGGHFVCVEYELDGAANEVRTWLDGIAHPEMTANASNVTNGTGYVPFVPVIDSFEFGLTRYQTSTTPLEIWMDDIAIGPSRIGCSD